jgi:hypothetical protein
LVEFRQDLFQGASHDYWDCRTIADLVPDSSLQLTAEEAHSRLGAWRSLIRAD